MSTKLWKSATLFGPLIYSILFTSDILGFFSLRIKNAMCLQYQLYILYNIYSIDRRRRKTGRGLTLPPPQVIKNHILANFLLLFLICPPFLQFITLLFLRGSCKKHPWGGGLNPPQNLTTLICWHRIYNITSCKAGKGTKSVRIVDRIGGAISDKIKLFRYGESVGKKIA